MDLESQLIECCKRKEKGGWKCSLASLGVHSAIIAVVIFMGMQATHKVDAAEKPIHAFLASGPAPPPPPPPPPPAGSSAPKSTPLIKPVPVQTSFVQPREIPKQLPKVDPLPTSMASAAQTAPADSQPSGEPQGVPGGVAGGVDGGVAGGVVGGQVGGQVGGVLGGVVGGTGTTEAAPAPPPPPPPPAPEPKADDGPLRVGGDVKAPSVTHRVEPKYTDPARRAHTSGVVIVEAIIDKDGNVDRVKVLKGLDFGLTEEAVTAVKQWKFKPGTLNGQPVDVVFDLTVNFALQ